MSKVVGLLRVYGQCCRSCLHWDGNRKINDNPLGECNAEPVFPDSRYAISPGNKRRMLARAGSHCPMYEEALIIEEAEDGE